MSINDPGWYSTPIHEVIGLNLTQEIEWWASEAAAMNTEETGRLLRAMALRIKELEANLSEEETLRTKLTDILSRTAIALNGPEPTLTRWSWHNLPKLAENKVNELRTTRKWFDRMLERERQATEERDAALRALENKP
jgi:hypothetical protein